MSKKLLLPLIVILLLAGGAYAYSRKSSSPAPAAPANQTEQEAQSESVEFAKAIQSGRPTLCTLTKESQKMEYKIKGEKMRGDINVSTEGKAVVTHMVKDSEYLYMWQGDQKQGTKVSLTMPSASPYASVTPQDDKPNFGSQEDYEKYQGEGYTINCTAGSVSDADFVPPADIKFIDPAEMMKVIPSPGANGQVDYQKLQEQYGSLYQPSN